MPTPIQLIVGLGNPGAKYEATRHNAGFWFVDGLAQQVGGQFRKESRFQADVCKVSLQSRTAWLLKPMTYMNESGRAVSAIQRFYKIAPENTLVVHDELDLPVGVARLKRGGGHGGHNGLRSVIACSTGKAFSRLRIGIAHPRDDRRQEVIDYVLASPGKQDSLDIDAAIDRGLLVLPSVLEGDFEKAMNELHRE